MTALFDNKEKEQQPKVQQETDPLDDLWYELVDIAKELEDDLKGNRRGQRHVRSLKETIGRIDTELRNIAQRKKILK